MRLVLRRDQWNAAIDVYDPAERSSARPAGDGAADADLSDRERSDHRCVMEFPREKEDQTVQAAPAGCGRWNLAHAAKGHRPGSGVPEMYRMFSLPGRLSCFAGSPYA